MKKFVSVIVVMLNVARKKLVSVAPRNAVVKFMI